MYNHPEAAAALILSFAALRGGSSHELSIVNTRKTDRWCLEILQELFGGIVLDAKSHGDKPRVSWSLKPEERFAIFKTAEPALLAMGADQVYVSGLREKIRRPSSRN